MGSLSKCILSVLAALPFLLKFPYLISSWRGSPFERFDFYIWILIPPIAVFSECIRRYARVIPSRRTYPFAFAAALIVSVALYAFLGFKLNAVGLLLGMLIFMFAVELIFGRQIFLSQMPAFFFALTTIPNLSFWLSFFLDYGFHNPLPFFASKLVLGVAFFTGWSLRTLSLRRYPRVSSIAFCMCALLLFWVAAVRPRDVSKGAPFILDLERMKAGRWTGVDIPESESDLRMFSEAKQIERREYFDDNSAVSLLAVEVGSAKQIHPFEICLRSSGVKILSTKNIHLPVGGDMIQVNEVLFKKDGGKFAGYSFFSDGKCSTGYFTKFRLSGHGGWVHYQIITPAKDAENARRRAGDFLEKFGSAK